VWREQFNGRCRTRDRIISWSILVRGTWEPAESKVLVSLLREGDVAIDAGANIGWYSVLFSKVVGEQGRVIAIEPEPRNLRLLSANVKINGRQNINIEPVALAQDAGTVQLTLNPENFGDHHVAFTDEPHDDANVFVAAKPLDAITENIERIRLLKIDCQGAEPAIVTGAKNTLAKCDYVVTEYWPDGLRRSGFSAREYLQTMQQFFTGFCRVREGASTFRPISELLDDAASVSGPAGKNDAMDYLFKR
jgi:FkbM family methyltransferase